MPAATPEHAPIVSRLTRWFYVHGYGPEQSDSRLWSRRGWWPPARPDNLDQGKPPRRSRAGCDRVAAQPVVSLAAAFIACLYSRTLPSEDSSVMSATALYDPSSPYTPVASRQPVGATSNCLASNATKIRDFCLPNPGNSPTRRTRSAPVFASVHS